MLSAPMRRVTAAAGVVIMACLIAGAAAVSAHGTSQPQRQIGMAALTHFKVVLTATRGGSGHRLQATVTASGYRRSGGHWVLIAAKRIGKVNGWEWDVDTCALTATQFKPNQPSPPYVPFDAMKVSLLMGPALGCSTTYTTRWTP